MPTIKICVVEDLTETRGGRVNLFHLESRSEVLASFSNAEHALSELEAWEPDIVIMDINLPVMNGIECIRKLKTKCPKIQFMMFTIYEDDEKIFEALTAGASGYLLKTTPLSKIGDALAELHQGGSPMSTQIARKLINKLRISEQANKIEVLTPR